MAALHAFALGILGLLSLTATASIEGECAPAPVAQIGVQPDPILTANTNATVAYQNPNRPNQVITVEIDDGGYPTAQRTRVEILLDANGYGSIQWTVPSWEHATFNAPDANPVGRLVVSPT
jgi:hypothetical protein